MTNSEWRHFVRLGGGSGVTARARLAPVSPEYGGRPIEFLSNSQKTPMRMC
jgi:hypothetical protein